MILLLCIGRFVSVLVVIFAYIFLFSARTEHKLSGDQIRGEFCFK